MVQTTFRFGELEAILADLNGVPSHQRTAFQARLKNFHRLGFPEGMGTVKGRATLYSTQELIMMAVAVELTQLGLTPERAIEVFKDDPWPVWMSVMMAAEALVRQPHGFRPERADHETTDPESMFLFFDPAALAPWNEDGSDRASSTFFFGSARAVRENVSRWTTGPTRRVALINVTAMIWQIAASHAADEAPSFLHHIGTIATEQAYPAGSTIDEFLTTTARASMLRTAGRPRWGARPKWLDLVNLDNVAIKDFYVLKGWRPFVRISRDRQDKAKPDMVVALPGRQRLVVDSKIAADAETPQQAIRDRVTALVQHNPYQPALSDNTDFRILYVSSEKQFADAIAVDRALLPWALEKKVIIATPSVLAHLLFRVEAVWRINLEDDETREEFEALRRWKGEA